MKKFNLAALAVLDLLLLSSCSKESKGIVIEKTQKRNTKAHHTITL